MTEIQGVVSKESESAQAIQAMIEKARAPALGLFAAVMSLGLSDGPLDFGGEESTGTSSAPGWRRLDYGQGRTHPGSPGRGDHPRAGRDLGALYAELTREFGVPVYERIDAPFTTEQK